MKGRHEIWHVCSELGVVSKHSLFPNKNNAEEGFQVAQLLGLLFAKAIRGLSKREDGPQCLLHSLGKCPSKALLQMSLQCIFTRELPPIRR